MTPNVVVIPSRYRGKELLGLAAQLMDDPATHMVVICDNGYSATDRQRLEELKSVYYTRMRFLDARNWRFHKMWNKGWEEARAYARGGEVNVLFLNDDVSIPPGLVSTLSFQLRSRDDVGIVYPDYTRPLADGFGDEFWMRETLGTYTQQGMSGFAFMIRGELEFFAFDEAMVWICGDDDIAETFHAEGWKQARVMGLPIEHVGEASTKSYVADYDSIRERDTELLREKWGPIRPEWQAFNESNESKL